MELKGGHRSNHDFINVLHLPVLSQNMTARKRIVE
jgi:hypothetical protein